MENLIASDAAEQVEPRWDFWARFSGQQKDFARLHREYKAFCVELDLLAKSTKQPPEPWLSCAQAQMRLVAAFINGRKKDVEGGWVCFNAARRYAVNGLQRNEIAMQASVLLLETDKISSWRADAIKKLVDVKDEDLTAEGLIMAMALRDEYFSNQYHKVWMVAGQLRLLLYVCGMGLLFLVPLVGFYSRYPNAVLSPWGYQMVLAVCFFGLFGAAFSTAGSLMNPAANARIPERVANQFVTSARSLFGAGAGLAGYAFYQAKVLDIHVGTGVGPGDAITVAFAFGFAGEMLISKVLGSLGGRSGS